MNSYAWIHFITFQKREYKSYIIKSACGSLQFLLIYRKAKAGELAEESGLSRLAKLTEINVKEVGVGGAKDFFEAKVIICVATHVKEHCRM